MSEFTGMALYSQSDIKAALTNYRIGLDRAKVLLAKFIKEAEDNWQPNWWDKVRGVVTLKHKYMDCADYEGYFEFILEENFLQVGEEDYKVLEPHLFMGMFNSDLSRGSTEYNQITNLYGSGRDCYLTPSQAKFVNKFKVMEIL